MEFQDIMILIQTFTSFASLITSLLTLNRVNKISNKQIAIGKKNKQAIN